MFLFIYFVGVGATLTHFLLRDLRENDLAYMPTSKALFLSWASTLWPAYWAGRALAAPIDRLMLPPGEGV